MNLSQAHPSLITVDDPYTLTEPAGISAKMVLAFALLMGIILPMALLYFVRYKSMPLSAEDIASISQVPVLGAIKKDGANDAMPVLQGDGGESIRQLRAEAMRIIDGLDADSKGAIMVASPVDGEGKTYLATNLAASLALLGKSVLLVEADLTKGNEPLMGYNLKSGVADLIDKNADACVVDIDLGAGARMSLLGPGNVGNRNADDIVGHEAVKAAIGELMAKYQYTVIDTASYSNHSGAYELAALAGLTLCPVAVGISTADSVEQADVQCADGRLPRVAIVVNMA